MVEGGTNIVNPHTPLPYTGISQKIPPIIPKTKPQEPHQTKKQNKKTCASFQHASRCSLVRAMPGYGSFGYATCR